MMRLPIYLLILLGITTAGLTGCEGQSGQEVHFGPNPGDRIIDDDESSE